MAKILITGIGLIGTALAHQLKNEGHTVQFLSRSLRTNFPFKTFIWNVEQQELDKEALKDVSHIIHLAGANIAEKRWTSKRRKQIIDSRVNSTRLLRSSIKEENLMLESIVCASAIGYYGAKNSETYYKETDAPHNDFISEVCQLWENEIDTFKTLGIRTVTLRTGIVFSSKGGALKKMCDPIKNNFGAIIGKGNQIIPWIHITDLNNIYSNALFDNTYEGVINAVAPSSDTNKDITRAIAEELNKKIWLPPIPPLVLKILFGEMAIILLTGSNISVEKLKQLGFKFEYEDLKSALKNLL